MGAVGAVQMCRGLVSVHFGLTHPHLKYEIQNLIKRCSFYKTTPPSC